MTQWTVSPRGAGSAGAVPPGPRRRTPPPGALRPDAMVFAQRLRGQAPAPAGAELIEAGTADGLWALRRQDDTASTWDVMCVPTRQVVGMGHATLLSAWEFTQAPGLLRRLRDITAATAAGTMVPPGGVLSAAERDVAQRAESVLDGLLDGAPALLLLPDTVCVCGGLLAETGTGVYEHLGMCRPGCYDPARGLADMDVPCRTPARHVRCDAPAPAECVHHIGPGCLSGRPDANGSCEWGEDGLCCGCCTMDWSD